MFHDRLMYIRGYLSWFLTFSLDTIYTGFYTEILLFHMYLFLIKLADLSENCCYLSQKNKRREGSSRRDSGASYKTAPASWE